MNNDAISRSAVLALSRLEAKPTYSDLYGANAVVDVEDIENLPALDVAPVVHARWENHHCTHCLKMCTTARTPSGWIYFIETPYCPNCGARMDGEADG